MNYRRDYGCFIRLRERLFSDNEKILLSDELEYGMAIHNAKILRDYKLDEKNYALKITADGGVLLAIRSGDYPMALAGSPAGVDELVLEIDRRGLVFTDILGASDITAAFIAGNKTGASDITAAFIAGYQKVHPIRFKKAVSMEIMAFEGEGKFCAEVAPVSAADVDTVAGFVRGFYRECFDEEVSPQSAREQAERMIPRMLGYYADGRLAAIARPSRETNRYINISNVYTDPGYRGRGYMQVLILHVCKLIQDAGKTPSLYVDVANPISSRVYKKVGFRSI